MVQAAGTSVRHLQNAAAPEGSLFSSACEATSTHLDFTFAVPPECSLQVRMYFPDPTDTPRTIQVYANGSPTDSVYDLSATGTSSGTLDMYVMSPATGLLALSLMPVDGSGPALISGMQIYAAQDCPKPVSKVFETTGVNSCYICCDLHRWTPVVDTVSMLECCSGS